MKIKENPGCLNKGITQTLNTIIRLPGPIPELKKSALVNDYENIYCILGKS